MGEEKGAMVQVDAATFPNASSSSPKNKTSLNNKTTSDTNNTKDNNNNNAFQSTLDPLGTAELSKQLSRRMTSTGGEQLEDGGALAGSFDKAGQFHLDKFLQNIVAALDEEELRPPEMGVTWKNLTVRGQGTGVKEMDSVSSLFKLPSISKMKSPPLKTILDSFEGDLQPGEMLLVLGRPGAGCTSFLKTLASYRDGFHSVEGDITYNGLSAKDIQGPYRGEVVFAPEDDIHFPTLTVHQTLAFAAASRAPAKNSRVNTSGQHQSRIDYTNTVVEVLATILGLKHTYNTKVGNDAVRGVSGGERKRVTVAEALASRAKIALFDNSSRGLDSSTALEFVKSLRIGADVMKIAVAASIYQAGEGLTDLFDKVVIIHQGQQVYFGGIPEAVAYFEGLGFRRVERQTTADFLVACASGETVATKDGMDSNNLPLTPLAQRKAWLASKEAANLSIRIDQELKREKDATALSQVRSSQKASHTRLGSSYTISIPMQIKLAVKRRFHVAMGDPSTLIITAAVSIFQALIIGSVFVQMAPNTSAYFSRGGVIFTALLFNSLQSMSEITKGYAQRPIVVRHKKFAFIHPAADAFADTLLDMPIRLCSLLPFIIVLYFMTGLAVTADQFFVFLGILILTSFTLAAFFRMLAAIFKEQSAATMVAGISVIDMVLYAGYAIPRPSMVIWWKWLSYCNPISFAFEILITNEFRRLDGTCSTLIPSGTNYANTPIANKVCAITSAIPGQSTVNGSQYLLASYGYTYANTARNSGILIGFWIFFVLVHVIASEFQGDPSAKGGVMVFKDMPKEVSDDEEKNIKQVADVQDTREHEAAVNAAADKLGESASTSTFTWHNLNYDVQIKDTTRRLLNDVSGYVAPGKMTALMGESGAGKTTLLNVLAQRTTSGVVYGSFLVDGHPIGKSFQAATGYCQQQDVHLETQTVREAIQFSALLRQSANVSESEKLAYVEEVMDLLEMQPYANAIVGNVGEGLSLEQRKRLTIAVELAAKPALLLFLDEPTSGLDAMAAWSIVRLLRKLADAGQAILCTIHQPSGELFNQFDRLLLLQKGGKTVYFGDLGKNSQKLIHHFEEISGNKCDQDANPAEYILDVIGAGATSSSKVDWHEAFLNSSLKTDLDTYLAPFQQGKEEQQVHHDHDEEGKEGVKEMEYTATFATQFKQYLGRIFLHYWRSPQYIMSKIMLNIISGLFIGSSFWGQGSLSTSASLENKIFAIFMALVVSTPLAQQLQPVFFSFRSLYEVREKPSKMYAWPVMVLSCILVEIPFNLVGGSLFFIPWYFMVGFAKGRIGGILWGFFMLYQFFFATLAQAIAALTPNATLGSVVYSSMFSFVVMFCGVLQPPAQLPYFWRVWMHPLTPFTYIIEGMLGPVLGGKSIRCSSSEFQTVVPPSGETCQTYLGAFTTSLDSLGSSNTGTGMGYFIENMDGTCGYCQYRVGDEYLSSIGDAASNFGRDFGIIVSYVAFNFFLCLGAYYLFQVASFSRPSSSSTTPSPKGKKSKDLTGVEQQDEKDSSHSESDDDFEPLPTITSKVQRVLTSMSAESSGVTRSNTGKKITPMPVSNPLGFSQILPQRSYSHH